MVLFVPRPNRVQLTPDLTICPIVNGLWQVSGAHGAVHAGAAVHSMMQYFDAGFTTWDLADFYGPAEDLIGEFRQQLRLTRGPAALANLQILTKWVPDPGAISRSLITDSIDRSLQRMNLETIDLLQLHWWDFADKHYLDALMYLTELQRAGKIRQLGLTNFDTKHLQLVLDSGIKIVSNQVQYSVVDRRPETAMARLCREHDIQLFTYGTLCGGFLSELYRGKKEPDRPKLDTASLRKYKHMIDLWGNWSLFQELLTTLQRIATKHQVSIANVAVRYILSRPAVAGVIVGTRLSLSEHIAENARVFQFVLDADDHSRLEAILGWSRDLYQNIGDCGNEYRLKSILPIVLGL